MLNTVKLFIHIFKLRKKYYYIFSQFHSIFSTVFVDKNAAALLSRKVFYSLGVFFFLATINLCDILFRYSFFHPLLLLFRGQLIYDDISPITITQSSWANCAK